MKEAIGGISIFQIVILFILLFTGIMCLTINHSKAYGVKDEVINYLQNNPSARKGNSLKTESVNEINNILSNIGYRVTGACPDGYTGYTRSGDTKNSNASFCIKVNDVGESFEKDAEKKCGNVCTPAKGGSINMYYYDIVLFYKLDIPIVNNILTFKTYGSTKAIMG